MQEPGRNKEWTADYAKSPQFAPHELRMTCILLSGEKLSLTPRQSWQMMTDFHSLLYFTIVCGLIAYLYPQQNLVGLPWWQTLLGFSTMGVLLVLLMIAIFIVTSHVFRHYPSVIIPTSLGVVASVTVMEFVKRNYAFYVWGPEWVNPQSLAEQTVTDYIFFLAFEFIYSKFVVRYTRVYPEIAVRKGRASTAQAKEADSGFGQDIPFTELGLMPKLVPQPAATVASAEQPTAPFKAEQPEDILPEGPALPTPAATTPPRNITIAGQSFLIEKIRIIRAEEHYIRIISSEGEKMLRFRMQDVVAQLPKEAGMQVHRSYWVRFDAITSMNRLPEGKLLLTLGDGTKITVPRARRKVIETACAKHIAARAE